MTFVSKGMAQNSGKSQLCNVQYGKLCDGEQQVLVFLEVLWYANKCIVTDFRIHLFSDQKMTFVSKGMAQNSGKSHLCNVKYGKLYDGEQQVLVFLNVLWYANKCIVTDFRIHLFSGQKITFVSKGMAQNSGKSHVYNVKYGKLYYGEQQVLVFLKVLLYANKCIVTDFRIHLFSGQKMTFVSKGMAQNLGKSHVCDLKYGKLYDGEQQVQVFLKVLWYANKCIVTGFRIHIFSGQKYDFCIKREGSKFGKIATLQCTIW